ncbi:MAG: hypothetical protein IJ438_03705 [Clostridia bacterium]|nr:hypothetical protein [Clostridia bacterium]
MSEKLKKALDTSLSGMVWSERDQADVLRAIRQQEVPEVKHTRRISLLTAFAMVTLVIVMGAALAAGLTTHEDGTNIAAQPSSESFLPTVTNTPLDPDSILFENDILTVAVDSALYDGISGEITLRIRSRDNAQYGLVRKHTLDEEIQESPNTTAATRYIIDLLSYMGGYNTIPTTLSYAADGTWDVLAHVTYEEYRDEPEDEKTFRFALSILSGATGSYAEEAFYLTLDGESERTLYPQTPPAATQDVTVHECSVMVTDHFAYVAVLFSHSASRYWPEVEVMSDQAQLLGSDNVMGTTVESMNTFPCPFFTMEGDYPERINYGIVRIDRYEMTDSMFININGVNSDETVPLMTFAITSPEQATAKSVVYENEYAKIYLQDGWYDGMGAQIKLLVRQNDPIRHPVNLISAWYEVAPEPGSGEEGYVISLSEHSVDFLNADRIETLSGAFFAGKIDVLPLTVELGIGQEDGTYRTENFSIELARDTQPLEEYYLVPRRETSCVTDVRSRMYVSSRATYAVFDYAAAEENYRFILDALNGTSNFAVSSILQDKSLSTGRVISYTWTDAMVDDPQTAIFDLVHDQTNHTTEKLFCDVISIPHAADAILYEDDYITITLTDAGFSSVSAAAALTVSAREPEKYTLRLTDDHTDQYQHITPYFKNGYTVDPEATMDGERKIILIDPTVKIILPDDSDMTLRLCYTQPSSDRLEFLAANSLGYIEAEEVSLLTDFKVRDVNDAILSSGKGTAILPRISARQLNQTGAVPQGMIHISGFLMPMAGHTFVQVSYSYRPENPEMTVAIAYNPQGNTEQTLMAYNNLAGTADDNGLKHGYYSAFLPTLDQLPRTLLFDLQEFEQDKTPLGSTYLTY